LLGNSDAIAHATLTALWLFLLPIFKLELNNRRKQQRMAKVYFFVVFVYIRFYQPISSFQRWLHWGRDKKCISKDAFYANVVPITHLSATHLNEIKWDDRLSFNSHHQHAPDWVTFAANGFPQLVWQPVDPLMRSLLYVPDRYAAVVYKPHIAIDLTGNVVHFSGLHLGTTPDGAIWRSTANEHPTERNEFDYGDLDLAYKGCDDLITNSEPLNQNAPLTAFEGAYNKHEQSPCACGARCCRARGGQAGVPRHI
jgi:hypothetical protein